MKSCFLQLLFSLALEEWRKITAVIEPLMVRKTFVISRDFQGFFTYDKQTVSK